MNCRALLPVLALPSFWFAHHASTHYKGEETTVRFCLCGGQTVLYVKSVSTPTKISPIYQKARCLLVRVWFHLDFTTGVAYIRMWTYNLVPTLRRCQKSFRSPRRRRTPTFLFDVYSYRQNTGNSNLVPDS